MQIISSTEDRLQNNHMAPKAPFLPRTHQKPPYRTRGTLRQSLPASEQKSSLLASMAYSARGLKLKTRLAYYLRAVERGRTGFIITQYGQPIALLEPQSYGS